MVIISEIRVPCWTTVDASVLDGLEGIKASFSDETGLLTIKAVGQNKEIFESMRDAINIGIKKNFFDGSQEFVLEQKGVPGSLMVNNISTFFHGDHFPQVQDSAITSLDIQEEALNGVRPRQIRGLNESSLFGAEPCLSKIEHEEIDPPLAWWMQ